MSKSSTLDLSVTTECNLHNEKLKLEKKPQNHIKQRTQNENTKNETNYNKVNCDSTMVKEKQVNNIYIKKKKLLKF